MNYVKLSIAVLALGLASAACASNTPPLSPKAPAKKAKSTAAPAPKGNAGAAAADVSYAKKAKDWLKERTKTQCAIAGVATVGGLVALYKMNESFNKAVNDGVEGFQDMVNDAKEGKNNAHLKLGAAAAVLVGGAGAAYWYREEIKNWWNE